MNDDEFDAFIDKLIDSGAIDNNDKLLEMIDQLPEDQKLKVMDEMESIRNELDTNDIVTATKTGDVSSLDDALDKKASRKEYRDTEFDNPVDEEIEIDKDSDGDPDVTITKQDDGDDSEPTSNTKDNSSEEEDEPSEEQNRIISDAIDDKSSLNSNVVNAVAGHRF